nr:pseudouridine-5'-phosphatase-like [Dermacentor andersoni]
MGDFNAQHQAWGYCTNTKKGRDIWDAATEEDLTLITNKDFPTRRGNSVCRDTTPDLTFVKNLENVKWTNTAMDLDSDHCIIEAVIKAAYSNPDHHVLLRAGVERLVRHLRKHGVPMAIATSSKPTSFELKTTKHRELVSLFHHVVMSGSNPEVKHGKPHPDVFLVAASKFDEKPPPEKVLVFEDAPKGVTAALAAGMQVIMIPDARMDEENRRRATLCIASLLDFKPEQFGLPPFEDGTEDGLEDGPKKKKE